MNPRQIRNGIQLIGAEDWNRRLFDSLIPLPDGTSYNAYLVQGSEKTALLDTVDPSQRDILLSQLADVPNIDYLVSHHTEQDHSGTIPVILKKYPSARLICSLKAKELLMTHLHVYEDRIQTVADGESISLGNRTLRFVYTPWVHWPETMATYIPEDRILFSCDFFGSHLATSEMFAGDDPYVIESAKRYYAEIMMPFRAMVQANLIKVRPLEPDIIAPSHGPLWNKPRNIMDAYERWSSDKVNNLVVIPYISMHGSTQLMVDYLVNSLVKRGIEVQPFELCTTDLGKLAMSLVDAATIVIGTPTVHIGPHPMVASIAILVNALRPRVRYLGIIGSYGWGTKVVENLSSLIPNLKVEVVGAVLCKGLPREEDYAALEDLAEKIQEKHASLQPVVASK